jgi:hypothetical protein
MERMLFSVLTIQLMQSHTASHLENKNWRGGLSTGIRWLIGEGSDILDIAQILLKVAFDVASGLSDSCCRPGGK